jgi:D-xylose transport system substrate-binding protein
MNKLGKENYMKHVKRLTALLSLSVMFISACVSGPPPQNGGASNTNGTGGNRAGGTVRIGFSMDTLEEERWQRDKNLFEERARELGVEAIVQVANGSDARQIQQCEQMLTQGINVLVIAPHNATAAASIVDMAHRQNVPVISYDRLIRNADVDLYVSHQVVRIGEMQARYVLERAPRGDYIMLGGASTDNNAALLRDGQMNVLQPAIDRNEIRIVYFQWVNEWRPDEARRLTETAITQHRDVVAIVAPNDGTAGGAIEALPNGNRDGRIIVSGQDAELAAMQRIAEGRQAMTIYKPIRPLAHGAVDAAIRLARREQVQTNATIPNGRKDVPAMLHDPMVVDRNNIVETVVRDGYHRFEDIYRNVPPDRRPSPPPQANSKHRVVSRRWDVEPA